LVPVFDPDFVPDFFFEDLAPVPSPLVFDVDEVLTFGASTFVFGDETLVPEDFSFVATFERADFDGSEVDGAAVPSFGVLIEETFLSPVVFDELFPVDFDFETPSLVFDSPAFFFLGVFESCAAGLPSPSEEVDEDEL